MQPRDDRISMIMAGLDEVQQYEQLEQIFLELCAKDIQPDETSAIVCALGRAFPLLKGLTLKMLTVNWMFSQLAEDNTMLLETFAGLVKDEMTRSFADGSPAADLHRAVSRLGITPQNFYGAIITAQKEMRCGVAPPQNELQLD